MTTIYDKPFKYNKAARHGVSSLMISYFADHNPNLYHEFVAFLAKDN